MFANFIYFIIALLILSLYTPPKDLPLSIGEALSAFVALTVLFAFYIHIGFKKINKQIQSESSAYLDHQFTQLSTRCSILSLALLAIDIWWLHLPAFLSKINWLSQIPTLNSLVFLLLFIGYLTIIWTLSFEAHKNIYRTDISHREYVYSNIAFSVPILIPWVLLFGITDIIQLLPFGILKQIFNDPIGQIAYFLVFLVIAAIFAPLLIQRIWRCRSMEAGPERNRIESLCQQAGVRYADIVYWPIFGGRMLTAGVMGLVSRFRYILVTDALMKMLQPEEVDQVIAHEIGHVKHKHLLLYLLFFIGFMVIAYAAWPVSVLLLFYDGPIMKLIKLTGVDPFDLHSIVNTVIMVVSIIVYFRLIFGFFMRNFERQADVFVFELFSTARPLISTFDKIVLSSGQPATKPNWHHFSIQQRIDYLWRCEQSPIWITRHNNKVKRSIMIYVAVFITLAIGSYQLNKIAYNLNTRYFDIEEYEAFLDQKEVKTTEDSMRYQMVGDVYYTRNNHQRAAAAYRTAILLYPKNAEALNSIAWLLATSSFTELRDPIKALEYAKKAISYKKAPHIWDTLAEALFINGRISEAIKAEEQALKMEPEDRQIYEKQLSKFKKALEESQ